MILSAYLVKIFHWNSMTAPITTNIFMYNWRQLCCAQFWYDQTDVREIINRHISGEFQIWLKFHLQGRLLSKVTCFMTLIYEVCQNNIIEGKIDGLMQKRHNSLANAMELHLFALCHCNIIWIQNNWKKFKKNRVGQIHMNCIWKFNPTLAGFLFL